MRLVLRGLSALSFWLSAYAIDEQRKTDGKALHDCVPTRKSLAYLHQQLPQLKAPYHLLVPSWIRPKQDCVMATSRYRYPTGSFYPAANGVFTATPELCFIQLGKAVSLHELVLYGSALCGTFVIDPTARGGLGKREPLTTVRKLAQYLNQNNGLSGVASARLALPYLAENAASPPEIFLQMLLALPAHLGGYGLPRGETNRRLEPSARACAIAQRKTLVPDCYWSEHQLALEYDPNAEHLTKRQVTRDATKRMALEADDIKVITVTSEQLRNPRRMETVAREIGQHCKQRLRTRDKRFPARHRDLYRRGWSLNALFNENWLAESEGTLLAPSPRNQKEGNSSFSEARVLAHGTPDQPLHQA